MANRSSLDKHVWNRHNSRKYDSFEGSRRMVFKTESVQQPPSDNVWNMTLLPWSPVGAAPLQSLKEALLPLRVSRLYTVCGPSP